MSERPTNVELAAELERRIQVMRDVLADVLARLHHIETGESRPRGDTVVSGDAIHGGDPGV